MAVCRKRSTNSAPEALSISYFTGRPPAGISMRTFTSPGGLRPAGICDKSMSGLLLVAGLRAGVAAVTRGGARRTAGLDGNGRNENGLFGKHAVLLPLRGTAPDARLPRSVAVGVISQHGGYRGN